MADSPKQPRSSWLDGPGSARPTDPNYVRGARLGLPAEGPGSVTSTGPRVLAYLIDALIGGLIGGIFNDSVHHSSDNIRGIASIVAFVVMTVVLLSLSGQTIGMRLLRVRVVPAGPLRFPWVVAILIRTAVLCLFIPAILFDRDSRGLHERFSGTVVVRV